MKIKILVLSGLFILVLAWSIGYRLSWPTSTFKEIIPYGEIADSLTIPVDSPQRQTTDKIEIRKETISSPTKILHTRQLPYTYRAPTVTLSEGFFTELESGAIIIVPEGSNFKVIIKYKGNWYFLDEFIAKMQFIGNDIDLGKYNFGWDTRDIYLYDSDGQLIITDSISFEEVK